MAAPAPADAPHQDAPSTADKVRYQVDRFLSWSPFARFAGLFALSFLLVLLCAVLALLVKPVDPEHPFDLFEALWWAMTRVADAGTMGDDEGTLVRFVATLATLSGVGVVALLIGLVSSTVGDKIDDLRKGKSPVIDQGHTLILGFGEKVFAVLRELRTANANQKHAAIVILSEVDKEDVETAVRERLGDMLTTRVVVRQGSPHSPQDLRKVGAARARSIVILSGNGSTAEDPDEANPDMGAIKTLLALRRIPQALQRNHAVVELADSSRRSVVEELGAGGVEVVAMEETLSRMMVQTARQNGLAQVYRDLLTYEGSEFYFRRFSQLAGQPFSAAQWRIKNAVVCGVRRAAKGDEPAQTLLNPPDTFVLEATDELLVIAEDDDTFNIGPSEEPEVPATFRGAPPLGRTPEKLLVCGHSPKLGDMMRELDNYVMAGSEAWLMPGVEKEAFAEFIKSEVSSLKNLRLKYVEGDPTLPEALKRVASPDFACAMVVADTTLKADEADARTVITVLLLRNLFKQLEGHRPRVISEILDPRTKDLLEHDYGADFVVSSEMTSMLLAQVSERRELNAVFADLFDADGNELYLKRAACYATVGQSATWLVTQKIARSRHEVAIGYVKPGQPPVLNPQQHAPITFAEEDRIIVIAEDDREAVAATDPDDLVTTEPRAPVASAPPPRPADTKTRSPLLPAVGPKPPVRAMSEGPRVQGPSTQPKPPLPPKTK